MYYTGVESEKEFCTCGNLLNCENTFSRKQHDEEDHPFYGIYVFKVLTCPACNSITALLYIATGNEYEDEENERLGTISIDEYKRRVLYTPKEQLHPDIPKPIAEVTHQAKAVLASSPRASFILCRAVLEEICNNFNIPTEKKSNKGFLGLKDRLSLLFEKQGMSKDLQVIINGIKDLGDKGAHRDHSSFVKQVDAQEAVNLLMLVHYVLERVFVDESRRQEAVKTLEELRSKILQSEHSAQKGIEL